MTTNVLIIFIRISFLIEQLFILFLLKQISHLLLGAPLSIR